MTVDRTVEAVWRLESGRIVAAVARLVRDVGLAEELAQDALVAALESWPVTGVPTNPAGWLMTTAKHRAIDRLRRDDRLADKVAQLGRDLTDHEDEYDLDGDGPRDDLLTLIFMACHPVLPTASRVALTLRVLGGLTTAEIARAFMVPEATVAQRIVRAKRALAGESFHVDRREQLPAVLEVIYLIFNEGYTATAGEEWMRPELTHEALRLGRVLAGLVPHEAEVHGLVALMELQASRTPARVDADGRPVPLPDQNRGRWDPLLIRRGYAALLAAERAGEPGPYVLQAAIAACHARARTAEETDWATIAALYGALHRLTPTPVVELNRAVAVAMADGPEKGLEILDGIDGLDDYHLLPSVRGDLLARLGRAEEARAQFARAADLTRNGRERQALRQRSQAPGQHAEDQMTD